MSGLEHPVLGGPPLKKEIAMRDSDRNPPGRTGAPPPVTTERQGGPPPAGAASLWEPGAVGAASLDDGHIEDLVTEEAEEAKEAVEAVGDPVTKDWVPSTPVVTTAASRPSGRTSPVMRGDRRVSPPVSPSRTVDEAASARVPLPPAQTVRMLRQKTPAPGIVRVNIEHFGAATSSDLSWVTHGDPGVSLEVVSPGARPRLVTVWLAFLVTEIQYGQLGEAEVSGIVRWHGMPSAKVGQWGTKLTQDNKKCLTALIETLQYTLAFPRLRVGMAVQFRASPLVTTEQVRRFNYSFTSGKVGDPAVKTMFNTVVAEEPDREALAYYQSVLFPWPLNSKTWKKFWRGHEISKGHAGHLNGDDGIGLDVAKRLNLGRDSAELALEGFMGSFFRVAFSGDKEVEAVMTRQGLPPVPPTRIGTMAGGSENWDE